MEKHEARIGLVGCGRVAENHAEAIAKTPGARLVAGAGGRNAAGFCEKHGIAHLDVADIAASGEIDALLVLTPPGLHHPYTMAALAAGKHVLVEKPVSFDENEIADMQSEAARQGVVCMPGHSYLYLPELARMARAVPAGGIGAPAYLYLSETYYMPPELFGKYTGPETDVLCHQLYMALAMFGRPNALAAFATELGKHVLPTGAPQVTVNLSFAGGALAQLFVGWAAEDDTSDPFTFKVKALGSKGGMHFSRRDYVQGGEQMLYQEMFDCQMQHFIHNCIGAGETPLSTMEDARWVCKLHGLVLRAAKERRTITL